MSETGIGVSVRRKEDRGFLTGNGNYLEDINAADQSYAYFVRPPINSLGFKGCVEAGAVATLAALINAVIDALSPLGITNIDMPATPQKVWQAIQDAAA